MYTDPGSGLLFFQVIAAAIGTIFFRFRRTIAGLIRHPRGDRSRRRD
jgi:hypothetical protein